MFVMEETPPNQVGYKTSDPEGGLDFFCLFLEQSHALKSKDKVNHRYSLNIIHYM